jgi:hypothetical protein
MQSMLGPVYEELGEQPFRSRTPADLLPDTKHRAQLISWACSMDVPDCLERAAKLFDTWRTQKEDHEEVNP